jgi:GNAT superfamily N-acetyltransferase
MERELTRIGLRTGEQLEVTVVEAPQPDLAEEFAGFYAHKEDFWLWHVERACRERLSGLETRFYTGRVKGQIMGCVVVPEHEGAGILTHVFTEPRARGKGVCSGLVRVAVEDFQRRSGVFLTLSTGYDSQAYRICLQAGFRSITQDSGMMIWEAKEGVFEQSLGAQPVRPQPLDWRHWPGLCGLAMTGQGFLRAKSRPLNPRQSFEGGFLQALLQVVRHELRAAVLEGRHGQALGFVFLSPRWPGSAEWVLELWVYPGFWKQAPALLESVGPLPEATRCYVDNQPERRAVLEAAGFREWARLERLGFEEPDALVVMRKEE